ncbi:exonuclease SbcCD subunit D, partial [Pectobacterium polaris]|nr:exonuclease SbcCD subunit D [Pectobacterium polaris]
IEDEDVIFENFMLFEKTIDEEPSAKKQELFKSLCKEQFT